VKSAFSLAIFIAMSVPAVASEIAITSPDHPRTYAYGEMIWHELYLKPSGGELAARITFSNLPYVGDCEPRRDEPFDFRFPGVQVDSARRTFFTRGRHREPIPVARFRGGSACGWIDLAPGAKIYLLKESGRITLVLTATDYPRKGMHWIEMDDNFSLQNLLVDLFGKVGMPRS
jgi:hypothetical protein